MSADSAVDHDEVVLGDAIYLPSSISTSKTSKTSALFGTQTQETMLAPQEYSRTLSESRDIVGWAKVEAKVYFCDASSYQLVPFGFDDDLSKHHFGPCSVESRYYFIFTHGYRSITFYASPPPKPRPCL